MIQNEREREETLTIIINSQVLNIQLMRYTYDSKTGRRKKIASAITFPMVIELGKYIGKSIHVGRIPEDDDDAVIDQSSSTMYELTSVLLHEGPNATSGHYTVDIKEGQ